MEISFSDEFSYTTALTNASSNSHEKCFYSAPTSPSRSALSGFQTESIIPRAYEDASSNADEFEFKTSRHFNLSESNIETRKSDENPFGLMQVEQFKRLQRGDLLPIMAFADELFCDGKVLPLSPMPPLKLPPRLLHMENGDKMINPQCSTASSPRSPGSSARRLPFPSQSLWNDNFDPFLVALDKVKEEKRGQVVMCELEKEPEKKAPRSPYLPSQQPKQLRVGSDEGTLATPLAMERKKNGTERGDFWRRKRKRVKIMKFLFGNADMDKSSAKHKSAGLVKPEVPLQSTHRDKNATNGEMTTTALVCYKPRLLICLGYGGRYVS